MPIPDTTLIAVEMKLRTAHDQSEPERLLQQACVGLNYLANLGHITRMLSQASIQETLRLAPPLSQDSIVDEVNSAFYVLGQLQSGISESTYGAITELYELLTKSKT